MFDQAALNASLNGLSAVFLSSGYVLIRRRRIAAHKVCMISAFSVSTAFLVSYVVYHLRVGAVHFQGQGWIRPVYFALLLTHTILAVVIVALAAAAIWARMGDAYDTVHHDHIRAARSDRLPVAAAERFSVDLSASFMVGDRSSDVVAGRSVGCYTLFVDRGYDRCTDVKPDAVVRSLRQAVQHILSRTAPPEKTR